MNARIARPERRAAELTVVLVIIGLALGVTAAPASAAPPWGACGRSTPEDKIVRQFPAGITLRCGGPIGSSDPRHGYRHILARHRTDFENMAFGTGTFQNWRDVADLSIETIANDPDVTVPVGGNQLCMSRVIFLNDRRTGQLVRQQIVRMFINATTRDVNTLHPHQRHC
ncbi:hypothetical protein EV188_102392 [Actinomycetospora succinea]|uniref:Uncharacterized protein n=1 Tax=Actinomycetospora succinea TaxID=663603 RepID=A0A4R6VHP0_9PSEU|nr:hypothetical protein [Actinomycetospora succinea]TDQ62737.1 hypothetical protein EV188_102392 [Actinomycetospora succinea]